MQIFSADKFFMVDGRYAFDREKLGEAHGWCLREYIGAVQDAHLMKSTNSPSRRHVTIMRGIPGAGKSTWIEGHKENLDIVVDNTNITALEIAPFASIANAYNIPFEIVTIAADPVVAHQRNVHNVPFEFIARHAHKISEEKLPSRWPQRTDMTAPFVAVLLNYP